VVKSPPVRVPRLRPDQLTADQRRLYEELLDGPRGQGPQFFEITDADGVLTGPFNAMLASPRVGMPLQRLGAALRYHTELPDQTRELVILVVAAHLDSDFEWYAHEPLARHYGVNDEIIAALRDGRPPRLADPAQGAAHDLAVALLRGEDVPDERYNAMAAALGTPGVFDVSAIVGYYWLLAAQLRLFRVGQPARRPVGTPSGSASEGRIESLDINPLIV
jgi:4-carboxymuconolactone decarboxylase